MSNTIQELKDSVVDYRNSVQHSLTEDELKIVDSFIDQMVTDVTPVFDLIDKMKSDKQLLSELKKTVDKHLGEDEWLEKLLKIS